MSALEIRNLRKAFGGLQVISDLDLKVPSGQRHAVIGRTGQARQPCSHHYRMAAAD